MLSLFLNENPTLSTKLSLSPTLRVEMYVLITIDSGKYSTAIFDKRDSFTFNIVNFPHLSSNIRSKPAYGVYISQLVRLGRSFEQFKHRHYTFTQKLIKQGFWYSGLCIAFERFAKYHAGIVNKYGCSIRKHIEEGICLPAIDGFLGRNQAAIRHFSKQLGVEMKPTSVQTWKGKYLAEISRKRKAGETCDLSVKSLPIKKRGRPLLLGEELDTEVKRYI